MKVITFLGVCFYICLYPVLAHYIYGDNSGTGYVSFNNVGDSHPIVYNRNQRRYMGLSANALTSVRISNDRQTIPENIRSVYLPENKHRLPDYPKTTEPTKRLPKNEDVNYAQDPRTGRELRMKNSQKLQAMNIDYKTNKHDQIFNMNKVNTYDSKGNVQVNVRKTQIPAEPQKVKINNNRQLAALSVQRREDQRMPTSVLVDKTLQKVANFKERNAKIMSRVLDDMDRKVTDRRVKNDYKKRDTASHVYPNAKHFASDYMKKYFVKEINKMSKASSKDAARIGNHEQELVENNAPYALFYRMNPESLDNQEGFHLMKSMEADGDKVYSSKQKRLSVNYQNEVDLKKPKTKKNINAVKLRKKVKNFSNFRDSGV